MEKEIISQERLRELGNDVLAMGGLVQTAIGRAIEALKKRDMNLAHQVIAEDAKVNDLRFNIEDKCIALSSAHLLPPGDMRIVVSILNIITELERVGDYAAGIGKIAIMIGDEPPLKPLIDIPRMGDITIEMIDKSLRSFLTRDVQLAKQVISLDSVVDSLYDQVFRELLTFMMTDPKTINRATRLIWVAHNLERAADRATNICERVIFTVTGKMEEVGSEKY